MRLIVLVIIVLAVALTFASAAEASYRLPTADELAFINEADDLADKFWADRDVHPPKDPTYFIGLPDNPNVLPFASGCAELGGKTIWIAGWHIRKALRDTETSYQDGMERMDVAQTIFHEKGHNAGLEHTVDDLGRPVGLMGWWVGEDEMPWVLRVWNREWLKDHPWHPKAKPSKAKPHRKVRARTSTVDSGRIVP